VVSLELLVACRARIAAHVQCLALGCLCDVGTAALLGYTRYLGEVFCVACRQLQC